MVYSKYFYPQQPRIPLILSLVLIFAVIVFLSKFLSTSPVPTKASKVSINNLNIVNPANNEVGIFWQTDSKEIGWVIYGEKEAKMDRIALDLRDVAEEKNSYKNHYVSIKNIKSGTKYFFKIVVNNQFVLDNRTFNFNTASDPSTASNLGPTYGKIIKENGQPLDNATVLLFFDNAYPLFSLSKSTGEWLIPVNNILSKETLKNIPVGSKTKLRLEIYDEELKKTVIQADLSSITPLPQTVIIGKDYSFSEGQNVLSAVTKNTSTDRYTVDILFPKELAVIPGDNPLIKGLGIPRNQVFIKIDQPTGYSGQTVVDNDGSWKLILNNPLAAGNHSLTMTTKDASGKQVVLTRKFNIAKSGEQVMGVATAAPTLTSVPTIIPSPTSFAVNLTPTLTPPVSGADFSQIAITSGSLIILGLGILFVF